ncbi:MAG: CDP-alcohol phosphatidyltransferase family protein [Gammaproteobacteria bacterium]|nr:CDP-alcohol phosphatidyltransferase family protein [Gammaproteobacteria bacterium]
MWFTWANGLSAIRLVVTLPCALAIIEAQWDIAAILFAIAVMTDFADGYVARRFGTESALGGLIDHSIDAIFVTVVLGAFALREAVPLILPLLVAASFMQYVLDSNALSGRALRSSFLGRWNGIAYYVLAGVPIGLALVEISLVPATWIRLAGWVLVASTTVSMLDRAQALIRSIWLSH